MKSAPFSKADRRLMSVSALAVAILAAGAWIDGLHRVPADTSAPQQLPVPNAYDTWAAAYASYVQPPTPGIDDINDPMATITLVNGHHLVTPTYSPVRRELWLGQNAQSLTLLRQGLKQQYLKPRSFEIYSGDLYYPHLREMARMLAIESHARALRGDPTGAAGSALDCIELGTHMTKGGALLGMLVGDAIETIGYDALWKTIPHLDAPATKQTLARLMTIDAEREPVAETLREEKARWHRDFIDVMSKGLLSPENVYDDYSVWARFRWKFANYDRILKDGAALTDKYIALADRPIGSIVEPSQSSCTWTDPLVCDKGLTITSELNLLGAARTKATEKLLILIFALRQFQLVRGQYPNALNDLAPSVVEATAIDPFGTGGPFHYRRAGASYLLYSVGRNGRDDHGKLALRSLQRHFDHTPGYWCRSLDDDGDMVAFAN